MWRIELFWRDREGMERRTNDIRWSTVAFSPQMVADFLKAAFREGVALEIRRVG